MNIIIIYLLYYYVLCYVMGSVLCYIMNIYINAVMDIIAIVFIIHIMSSFNVVLYSFGVSVSVVFVYIVSGSISCFMLSTDSKYEHI